MTVLITLILHTDAVPRERRSSGSVNASLDNAVVADVVDDRPDIPNKVSHNQLQVDWWSLLRQEGGIIPNNTSLDLPAQ